MKIDCWEGAVYPADNQRIITGDPVVAMFSNAGLADCLDSLALAWREHLAGDKFTDTPPPDYPEGT